MYKADNRKGRDVRQIVNRVELSPKVGMLGFWASEVSYKAYCW